jgi:hypothetical protein
MRSKAVKDSLRLVGIAIVVTTLYRWH